MRILHVLTAADPEGSYGGPTTVAVTLAGLMTQRGHEVHLAAGWTGSGPVPTELGGVPAHLFPARPLWSGRYYPTLSSVRLRAFLSTQSSRFDVMHVHLARDLIPLGAACRARRAGLPYLCQTHGMVAPDPRLGVRLVDRLATLPALRGAAERLALTTVEQHRLQVQLGPGVSVMVLPNTLPTVEPQGGEAPGPAARADPLPEVLFLARLHERKNPLGFVAAARLLLDRGVAARFALCGPDGGQAAAVREALGQIHPAGRVTYEGPVAREQVRRRLRAATVYVLTARDEPFAMTLLEAMAEGVACVCLSSSHLAPVLAAYSAGLVVEDDPGAVADGVARLLADPDLRQACATNARRMLADAFAPALVADRLEAAYTAAVKGGLPARVPASDGAVSER